MNSEKTKKSYFDCLAEVEYNGFLPISGKVFASILADTKEDAKTVFSNLVKKQNFKVVSVDVGNPILQNSGSIKEAVHMSSYTSLTTAFVRKMFPKLATLG